VNKSANTPTVPAGSKRNKGKGKTSKRRKGKDRGEEEEGEGAEGAAALWALGAEGRGEAGLGALLRGHVSAAFGSPEAAATAAESAEPLHARRHGLKVRFLFF